MNAVQFCVGYTYEQANKNSENVNRSTRLEGRERGQGSDSWKWCASSLMQKFSFSGPASLQPAGGMIVQLWFTGEEEL